MDGGQIFEVGSPYLGPGLGLNPARERIAKRRIKRRRIVGEGSDAPLFAELRSPVLQFGIFIELVVGGRPGRLAIVEKHQHVEAKLQSPQILELDDAQALAGWDV